VHCAGSLLLSLEVVWRLARLRARWWPDDIVEHLIIHNDFVTCEVLDAWRLVDATAHADEACLALGFSMLICMPDARHCICLVWDEAVVLARKLQPSIQSGETLMVVVG